MGLTERQRGLFGRMLSLPSGARAAYRASSLLPLLRRPAGNRLARQRNSLPSSKKGRVARARQSSAASTQRSELSRTKTYCSRPAYTLSDKGGRIGDGARSRAPDIARHPLGAPPTAPCHTSYRSREQQFIAEMILGNYLIAGADFFRPPRGLA